MNVQHFIACLSVRQDRLSFYLKYHNLREASTTKKQSCLALTMDINVQKLFRAVIFVLRLQLFYNRYIKPRKPLRFKILFPKRFILNLRISALDETGRYGVGIGFD